MRTYSMKNTLLIIFLTFSLTISIVRAGDIPDETLAKLKKYKAPEYVPDELIVKLKEGKDVDVLSNLNLKYGASAEKLLKKPANKHLERLYLLKFPKNTDIQKLVAEYNSRPDVEYAEPNYIINFLLFPNDTNFSQLWGLHNTGQTGGTPGADIDAPEAWDITTGSSTIVVGLIDSGIDYTHPDLAANMWTNPGEILGNGIDDDSNGYVDDVYGWDFYNNDSDPMDDFGHGTHCAGIIGAVGNNSLGVAGVNWKVKVAALKIGDASGATDAAAIEAINYATLMGFKITSNSWGGTGFSQSLLDAINAASGNDSLFIAAAGNDARNNDIYPLYPCNYDTSNIICVAATDSNDHLASFSNYGATTVDLGAPGVDIYSTFPNNNYEPHSGTSMATPYVSGAAALIKSKFPTLNKDQLKARMLYSTDLLPLLQGKVLSNGRLNAFNSLEEDTISPSAVTDLNVLNVIITTIILKWTAVGDDDNVGRASFYDLRYSTFPITEANFNSAKQVQRTPTPKDAGNTETFTVGGLTMGTTYYFAMKVYDNAGNPSPLSNIASGTTTSPPLPPGCDLLIDSAPYTIDRNNTRYCLFSNIIADTHGIIFADSTHDTTLNCQGFSITGAGSYYGVYLTGTNFKNIIKNCKITNFIGGIISLLEESNNNILTNNTANNNVDFGFSLYKSSNNILTNNTANNNVDFGFMLIESSGNIITNNTANNNVDFGFSLYKSSNNILTNNTANNNNWYGFMLSDGSSNTLIDNTAVNSNTFGFYTNYLSNNTIKNSKIQNNRYGVYLENLGNSSPNLLYNNLLNNTNNVHLGWPTTYHNYWNTTKQNGTRIYPPGTQIGGNYYTNSSGNEYSDTCIDDDADGFCDIAYTIGTNNIDYLSYSSKGSVVPTTLTQKAFPSSPQTVNDSTFKVPVGFTADYNLTYQGQSYCIPNATVKLYVDGVQHTAVYGAVNPIYGCYGVPYPINLSVGTHTWYFTASATNFTSQTGPTQYYRVSTRGGGGGGPSHPLAEIPETPTAQGQAITFTLLLIGISIIGYMGLRALSREGAKR